MLKFVWKRSSLVDTLVSVPLNSIESAGEAKPSHWPKSLPVLVEMSFVVT